MIKSYTVNHPKQVRQWLLLLVTTILLLTVNTSCRQSSHSDREHNHPDMHTGPAKQAGLDSPDDRLPADAPSASISPYMTDLAVIVPDSGTRIISLPLRGVVSYDPRYQSTVASRVTGRIQKIQVSYNFQPVRKGQLLLEIYSPDLAAAQQELLFLTGKDNPSMLEKAKRRLNLLGMENAQINEVIRSGKIMYNIPVYSTRSGFILQATTNGSVKPEGPGSAQQTPLTLKEGQYVNGAQSLFSIYDAEHLRIDFFLDPVYADYIKKGRKLLYYASSDSNAIRAAEINMIEPVIREGTPFTVVRTYIRKSGLTVGQLITGHFALVADSGYWIPRQALWNTGTKGIVFRKVNNEYVPREIRTGIEAGGMVQVNTPIGSWEILANAQYLVDSESFISTDD